MECVSEAEPMSKHKIVVAITGASGSVYAKVLLDKLVLLKDQLAEVSVVMSDNAKEIWQKEIGNTAYDQYKFKFWSKMDFNAPFAS